MCPIDPSPHGQEILHQLPEDKFLQASNAGKDHAGSDQVVTAEDAAGPDIAHRPGLPVHPEQMAADMEDEEEDPVVDSGPGIADGVHPPSRERG